MATKDSPPTARRRLRWVLLAFVPSSLMLGATTYMTTDIAAIPELWVLPLALYLLSFILVFSRLPEAVHRAMVGLFPFLVLLLLFLVLSESWLPRLMNNILVHQAFLFAVHLVVLFVAAMVCHGELARDRPATRYLTGFYLLMSFGGVLGGLFNALVAPLIFNGIAEYPLVLVLACLLMPTLESVQSRDDEIKRIPLGTGLMGLYLGAGMALLLPALARPDLSFSGLVGRDGFWVVTALLGALALVWLHVRAERDDRKALWLDLGLPLSLGVLALGLSLGLRIQDVNMGLDEVFTYLHDAVPKFVPSRLSRWLLPESGYPLFLCISLPPVLLCVFFINRPLRFGLGVGALLLAYSFSDLLNDDVLLRERSFFGALRVSNDGYFRRLDHGSTLHGMQRQFWDRPTRAAGAACPLAALDPFSATVLLAADQDFLLHPGREPLTYFHRTGPIGQVFTANQEPFAGRKLGLIGLGTGTLASYGQPGQQLTYYEIDPLIKRIAYDEGAYFTFVQDAKARGVTVDVVLGDARLKLEERVRPGLEEEDKFALLVVDAFSSDAIPIHLITREAIGIYLDNLAEDGLLAFHISNRYLDLEPVLGKLAEDLNLSGFIQIDFEGGVPGKASSSWVVLSRQPRHLDRLLHEWKAGQFGALMLSALPDVSGQLPSQGTMLFSLYDKLQAPWRKLKVRSDVKVWTDDYTNLLPIFDWKN